VIPYDLIVPSAARPHLLSAALMSLLGRVDQMPTRLIVHDDAAFPGRAEETRTTCESVARSQRLPLVFTHDDLPLMHGPSLHWLLSQVQTEYVLYTQDDLLIVRDLPIVAALETMHRYGLHQIRFNKRPTMEYKMFWRKKEFTFGDVTLTIADHWYFQTGLWRVSRIKPVVDWWIMATGTSFREHCEPKMNKAMNREVGEFNHWALANGYELPEQAYLAMDPDTRAKVQKTFIWGPIGTDRYIDNLGDKPEDWALVRPRGGTGPARVDSQAREA